MCISYLGNTIVCKYWLCVSVRNANCSTLSYPPGPLSNVAIKTHVRRRHIQPSAISDYIIYQLLNWTYHDYI
jgi:hypothetical protein